MKMGISATLPHLHSPGSTRGCVRFQVAGNLSAPSSDSLEPTTVQHTGAVGLAGCLTLPHASATALGSPE